MHAQLFNSILFAGISIKENFVIYSSSYRDVYLRDFKRISTMRSYMFCALNTSGSLEVTIIQGGT